MRKSNITLRMVAAILLLCLVLIPISSSVSMTQDRSPSERAPMRLMSTEGLSQRAILEISAAVVAEGSLYRVTTDASGGADLQ
jgi:hypothetical protein